MRTAGAASTVWRWTVAWWGCWPASNWRCSTPQAGDTEAAIDTLRQVSADSATTAGLRRRAGQLIVALGGDPEVQ